MIKQEILEWLDRFDSSKATGLRFSCAEYTLELVQGTPLSCANGLQGRANDSLPQRGEENHCQGRDGEIGSQKQDALQCDTDNTVTEVYGETAKSRISVTSQASAGKESDLTAVRAPLAGIFYEAPSPGAAPFVTVGQRVEKGQPLCLLEAMKMMNEVTAQEDCVVEQVYCRDGELVGFEAPLFGVRPV